MYVIGIDVGTTGTKALLVSEEGKIIAKGYSSYGIISSSDGCVEQDPMLWWNAFLAATKQACEGINSREVVALSLSTQGASSLFVDTEGRPITNAITWMDGRASLEVEELEETVGADLIYHKTGWRASPSLDAAKLKWFKKHEPDIIFRADKFLSTLEFINMRLVGRPLVDQTNAAIRQLMDIETLSWDQEIINATGCSTRLLPEIVPSGEFIGTVLPEVAETLGFCKELRVYNGAHDQYCASIGAGISKPGEIMLSTGTSWVLMAVTRHPLFTKSGVCPGPHIIHGLFGAIMSLGATGASIDWFKEKFLSGNYPELETYHEISRNRAGELFFFPWLAGTGYPNRIPSARGALIGLNFMHNHIDAALAIMEGVVYQMRLALEDYRFNGGTVKTIRIIGGALNNRFWMDLIRNNLDFTVSIMEERDAACVGAAAIALVGEKYFPDFNSAAMTMNHPRILETGDESKRCENNERYKRWKKAGEMLLMIYLQEEERK